ncbi:MAG: hypothetical protein ACRDGR_11130 [bacterium]
MWKSRFLLVLAVLSSATTAAAQRGPEKVRIEWITGLLRQGDLAEASLTADFGALGGGAFHRDQGTLSVDAAILYGLQGTWRVGEHLSFAGSWTHSRGRFQIEFPSLGSTEGTFDLEGLLLASLDFQSQQLQTAEAERAMTDAVTDIYLTTATWEFPSLNRWLFPYLRAGGGIFQQKSVGNVIQFEFNGPLPPQVEQEEGVAGQPIETAWGLSIFQVDETNPVLSLGGGFRASLGRQWGVDTSIETLTRFGVDTTYLNDVGTPPPDPSMFRFFSTSFAGKTGTVNNLGVRVSLTYALWPDGAPR